MASSDQPEWTGNDTLPDFNSKLFYSPPCSTTLLSLSAHSTLSIVPGTPGADLSVLFLSVSRPFAYYQPHVPLRGTLSAVGAIHAQKSIPALSYARMPLQNALLEPTFSEFHNSTTHMDMSILGKRLKTDMNTSNASNPKCKEFKHQEALLLFEVTRTDSAVCQSERNLAQMQLDKSTVCSTLYKYHVAGMQRRFNMAKSHVGSIHNSI
ncbi:hypothetical protein HD554DRAFT_2044737 [Boletus coccyginus]|nr:hypothetical protein HD554DRAFT_2044737 [Boletus coccyginus]